MATVADLEKIVADLQERVTDLEDTAVADDVTAQRVELLADAKYGDNVRPGNWPSEEDGEDDTDG